MAKKRVKNLITNLIPNHYKSEIALVYLCEGGMAHIIGKLLMRVKTLLWTLPQSKVYTKSYGPPKLQESPFREFWDSQLGNLGTK
jgi:hypothetical protein